MIGYEAVEVTLTLGNVQRDRFPRCVEEMGFAGFWRAYEIGGQGKEVLESEGERVFESRKDGLCEMKGWVMEFIEEKALHRAAEQPRYVKESERNRGGGN